MLNKKLLLIYCLFIVHLLSAQTKGQPYRPQYNKQWKEVTNYIHHDWVKQRSVSNNLPYAYITAWAGLPFMFYWDTYFINEGLFMNKLDSFAKNNIDNLLYAVDKFGYVGNAVMTDWGMNRSQPPYLSSMVRSVYERSVNKDTVFLRQAYNSLKTEYLFWTDTSANAIEQHNTSIKGLQRFYHHASSKELIILYGELAKRFNLPGDIQDNEKAKIATLYAVEAETGMDFTPRFEHRCPDFIAVELNSLLYVYEINFAWMVKTLQFKNEPDWNSMAMQRKELINEYCWDEKRGLYLDYDYLNKRGSKVAAGTTFQLLWTDIASKEQAKRLVKNLPLFETKWGIATVEKCGEIKNYQWGETSVWAPMQVIVAEGLDKYGYKTEAKRIASKFLDIVTKNFIAPVPETFKSDLKNIARKSGSTYEKYKTNGTINDDEYPASEMMGWTAGCFLWCYNYVTK